MSWVATPSFICLCDHKILTQRTTYLKKIKLGLQMFNSYIFNIIYNIYYISIHLFVYIYIPGFTKAELQNGYWIFTLKQSIQSTLHLINETSKCYYRKAQQQSHSLDNFEELSFRATLHYIWIPILKWINAETILFITNHSYRVNIKGIVIKTQSVVCSTYVQLV